MKKIYHSFLLLVVLLSCTAVLKAQTQVVSFTTVGTFTWVCPAGVSSIEVAAWGGGGGGGYGGTTNKYGGEGGGGGAYQYNGAVSVTPGTSYTIIVGAGGGGGNSTVGDGGNGGLSRGTFGATVVTANPGQGGQSFANGDATGGAGGTGTRNGGAGGGRATTGSGGGGGGAGSTGNGVDGGLPTGGGGGTGLNGGDGGAGTTANGAAGSSGSDYGGGGGGGTRNSNGGAGAQGIVLLRYVLPDCLSASSELLVTYTPNCTGTNETIATNAWADEYCYVNVTSGTVYTFTSSVGTDFLTLANTAGTIEYTAGTTPLVWTATVTSQIRFYVHTNSSCGGQETDRTIRVRCGTAPGGCMTNTSLWPSSAFTPSCTGSAESITSSGYATEYSQVNVITGYIYTFTSSITTDFLTIGNTAGSISYAYGVTPVVWTASFTGTVNFYNNTDASCGTNTTSRTRSVRCTQPVCSGTPTGGTAAASPAIVCPSSATTLSVTGATTGTGLTFQWQSAPAAGGPWTNISGATNATLVTTPTATTHYRRTITCTNGGANANSTSVEVTISSLSVACYCTSTATSTADMDITNVTFGSLSNASARNSLVGSQGTATGTAGQYSRFAGVVAPPTILAGISTPINVEVTQGSSNYSYVVVVYIDFNQNGLLTDAGESFVVYPFGNPGTVFTANANIAVPVAAVPGNTLMRVVCIESSTYAACSSYSWGETEDYNINIVAAAACTGTPTGGTSAASSVNVCTGNTSNLSVSGATAATGLTYQWESSPTGSAPWTTIASATSENYVATLTTTTHFRRAITCSGNTAYSTVVTVNVQSVANDECANATDLVINTDETCAFITNATIQCATASAQVNSCGATADDDDVWFKFVATAVSHNITISNITGSTTDLYHSVFSGTCGAPGTAILCSDPNTSSVSGLTIGNTYYVRVYSFATTPQTSSFDICVTTPPPFVLMTTATTTLDCGLTYSFFDEGGATGNYSSSSNRTLTLTAGTAGNSLRVSFDQFSTESGYDYLVVYNGPTVGSTVIGTYQGSSLPPTILSSGTSLTFRFISDGFAQYSGWEADIVCVAPCVGTPDPGFAIIVPSSSCGNPSLVLDSYSQSSGLTFQWQSASVATGPWTNIAGATSPTHALAAMPTPGTYYRCVVTCTNGGATATTNPQQFLLSAGQDCASSIPVCSSIMGYSNPGWQGTGTICDLPTSYCLASAEKGSSWYNIPITANGRLRFTIVPNDHTSGTNGTDYDFAIWKVTGSSSVTCAQIAAGTATPLACNYNGLSVTGLTSDGNSPAGYTGFDASFESELTVTNGEVYRLVINNHAASTVGFTVDFSSSTATINYSGTASTDLTWSGGSNTSWVLPVNWGGCSVPDCGKNVVIPAFSIQPAITSVMGQVEVNNMIINAGANLTLGPNSILKVCGSITNNGTIIASPTSTIIFTDHVTTHTLTGNFTGASKLGNLTITDVAGSTDCSVFLNNDLEVGGNLTTSNATSILNTDGNIITVGGHFLNAAAGTTFAGVTNTSALVFNGTTLQSYSPGGSLFLNNVIMNQAAPSSVLLVGNDMLLRSTGALSLVSGKIVTNALKVLVTNTTTTAVNAGNTNSYVEGNLHRVLAANATGSYNFPVGHATPGYELANVAFTSPAATIVSTLSSRFDPWGGGWPLPTAPNWVECMSVYNLDYLNNGYWTIDASTTMVGSYDLTLYNRSYSNHSAANGWSIAKSPSGGPAWALNGICLATSASGPYAGTNVGPFSPLTATRRNNMTGFSKFATIQAATPLPVKLLNFTGKTIALTNHLEWNTSSEENSDYFILQRSKDGDKFTDVDKVKAQGNSSIVTNYSDIDKEPFVTTYYRLVIVDKNGFSSLSNIVELTLPKATFNIGIRPNPAQNNLFVDLFSSHTTDAQIEILDMIGKVVSVKNITVEAGNNTIENDLQEFAKGVYFIKVATTDEILYNGKFVKQ
jgi:hypothetical protein